MQEINRFGDLIDYILFVPLLKIGALAVLTNECMEINVHMLKNQIDVLIVFGTNGLLQSYNIIVFQLPKEHNLSISPLRISRVRKGIEIFLESLNHLSLTINDFPDMTIGSATYLFNDLIAFQNVRFYLIGHCTIIYYTNNGTSDCNISPSNIIIDQEWLH